jgi:hypothetical protein
LAISADGKYAYAVHNSGAFLLPTNRLIMGWQNVSMMSVIDARNLTLRAGVVLDDAEQGAANPSDVVLSDDGRSICVAHAGTHEVSVIDEAALRQRLESGATDSSRNFRFLLDIRRRIRLDGNGPRRLATSGDNVYALEYFTESIAAVDIRPGHEELVTEIPLTEDLELSQVELGEMHFCDATQCFQQWQSCVSCHPNARSDGLNWDLGNDGYGNDKNSRHFIYSHALPPAMATGIRADAETAVRAGFKYIQFVEVAPEIPARVDEYLKSLRPVPSPHLVDGVLSETAERGKMLFESRGCASCHPAPYYSDMRQHTMGTLGPRDVGPYDGTWDTPTLVEGWRSAPYLHDGRGATLRDVLVREQHGDVAGLTEQEIEYLVEFLLSL